MNDFHLLYHFSFFTEKINQLRPSCWEMKVIGLAVDPVWKAHMWELKEFFELCAKRISDEGKEEINVLALLTAIVLTANVKIWGRKNFVVRERKWKYAYIGFFC